MWGSRILLSPFFSLLSPSLVSTSKHIRRMCSVQDSVLPRGVGRRKPHLSLFSSKPRTQNCGAAAPSFLLTPFFLLLSLTSHSFLLPFYLLFCVKKGGNLSEKGVSY